jgi:chromosome segregation ATPase
MTITASSSSSSKGFRPSRGSMSGGASDDSTIGGGSGLDSLQSSPSYGAPLSGVSSPVSSVTSSRRTSIENMSSLDFDVDSMDQIESTYNTKIRQLELRLRDLEQEKHMFLWHKTEREVKKLDIRVDSLAVENQTLAAQKSSFEASLSKLRKELHNTRVELAEREDELRRKTEEKDLIKYAMEESRKKCHKLEREMFLRDAKAARMSKSLEKMSTSKGSSMDLSSDGFRRLQDLIVQERGKRENVEIECVKLRKQVLLFEHSLVEERNLRSQCMSETMHLRKRLHDAGTQMEKSSYRENHIISSILSFPSGKKKKKKNCKQ